jgi:UrcA family protein
MICSTTYRSALSLAGALIMTLGTFSMLQASAPWESHRGEIVRYHDADLNQPASATRLYERIRVAARKVCEPQASVDLSLHSQYRHCVDVAVGQAVRAVNRPELDAVHSATIGKWRVASERLVKPAV